MSNEYFQPGSVPAPNSPGASAVIRSEFANIAAAFDKLPTLADNAGFLIAVDPTGTRLISGGFDVDSIVTVDGAQTLTNKTIAWDDNTFPGFGTAATKNANTTPGAGEVPVMVGPNLFGAIDGSNLINLSPSNFGSVVPVSKGGTGASDVTGAQASLGIDLKANINSPSFTGTPTAPTPGIGDASARVATTYFVANTLDAIGACTPSDDLPLMDGVASAGTPGSFLVSRKDHVHPTDTSRAPTSAATAAGTSFTPAGGVAATNVQTAIAELDTEKAPLASPAFTGTPTAPTPAAQDTSTKIATTAWVQSTIAALPPAGMLPDDGIPEMNGVGSAGTNAEASRGDHVHPTDTSRAPTSAATAAGTSFTPAGGVAATNVQTAIAELDTEKAPLASPAFTGNPTAPTPSPGDNDTSIATTAFVTAADALITADINAKDALNVKKTSSTGSAMLPAGTTAQRDASPTVGGLRFSTTLTEWEGWNGTNWTSVGGGQKPVPAFTATIPTQAVGTSLAQLICTEAFDPLNQFASNRFTPQVAGLYQVNLSAVNNLNDNWMFLAIGLNGSGAVPVYVPGAPAAIGGGARAVISALIRMNGTTDYLSALGGNSVAGFSILSGIFSACLVRAD